MFLYGVSQQLIRISDSAIDCGSYNIPRGVPVSLTAYIHHHDEHLFPSGQTFNSDRWLEDYRAPGTNEQPSKYLASFSKGSQS